jgi:hypothetical protein
MPIPTGLTVSGGDNSLKRRVYMDRLIEWLTRWTVKPFRPARAEVLSLINEARSALAMPRLRQLPSGRTHDVAACPISSALPAIVGVDGACFKNFEDALVVAEVWDTAVNVAGPDRFVASLPTALRRFVRDYDLGAYPSLERRRHPDRPPVQRQRPFDDRRPSRRAA